MAKVVVLGGCGAVGSVSVKALVKDSTFDQVVIGDIDVDRMQKLAATIGSPKVSVVKVNALDIESVKQAIKGSDVVLNCVGPFYNTVMPIVRAVVDSGINYVDICDDFDVTLELLNMHEEVKKAGITVLLGMGSSPGATNLLAKLAHDMLLEETDSIDIFHAHGGEPWEGEGVIGHRFHCMSVPIPMYLDGALSWVKFFEPGGIALRQKFSFPVIEEELMLYPYPHPEQITLPNYLKVRQVTNKGTVIPKEYYDLTSNMLELGLGSTEPLTVKGQQVIPYDFAVAYIIRERERILKEQNFGAQRGCCTVVAKGKNHGEYREYRFHMASLSQALGEGTGIPAALGAILMMQGKITAKGVLPPEGCVNPMDFISLIPSVMVLDGKKEGGSSFGGLLIQKVDADGNITNVDM
jgi:saccharopine dehydrogenase (NAD+, L-lysine-forming)